MANKSSTNAVKKLDKQIDFIKFIEQIPNITIAKRVASAYVADYRRLELDEIKEFASQGIFLHYDSIKKAFEV